MTPLVLLLLVGCASGFRFRFLDSNNDEGETALSLVQSLGNSIGNLFSAPDSKSGEAVSKWSPKNSQNPEELGKYFQGDLLFPAMGRNGLASVSARWPRGVIPYKYGYAFSSEDRATIERAFEEYKKYTCVRFVPRTNEADYLVLTSTPTGCWSSLGRIAGPQELNLQTPGCTYKVGTVIHELMHSLGFLHEQNRWERDGFVKINYENIEKGREVNFDKAKKELTDSQGVGYDYESVMHYSDTAFSVNGRPTITATRGNYGIGQREGLSKMDIQKIRRMYKCKSTH